MFLGIGTVVFSWYMMNNGWHKWMHKNYPSLIRWFAREVLFPTFGEINGLFLTSILLVFGLIATLVGFGVFVGQHWH